MKTPFTWTTENLIEGRFFPSTQLPYNNQMFAYWARALFDRAAYAIKIDLPEAWDTDLRGIFYYWLLLSGFVGVMDSPEFGLVFQPGTLNGYDIYYRPVEFIVANPASAELSRTYKIGEDCEIIKLCPDYAGIFDIINYYAQKLAQLSLSIDVSIINTRFAKIMGARNKAAAEALKKILDKVNRGEPAVIYDEKLLDDRTDKAAPFQEFGIDHLRENYITSDQLRDMQTILNAFDCEIGIPTVPYQKQERMVVSEAESRRIESVARVTVWIETLNSCFNKVNAKYGTALHAELREEGRYGHNDIDANRSV